jgi:uncharacterized protein YcbX
MTSRSASRTAQIAALNIYPVKSCAGIPLQRARLTPTGFEFDRQWMIVRPSGRFVTQRELPRLALISPQLQDGKLRLDAPDTAPLSIAVDHDGTRVNVVVWKDQCRAIDAGDEAAVWLERVMGEPLRLVRFDPQWTRASDPSWTGTMEALNQFSDGFPWLLISAASLDALNAKLARPLPMNRFRPNIVVTGLEPFEEDAIASLFDDRVSLRPVKPCTRCAITTTDQARGERDGGEPLRTLRTFRFDAKLRGVTFGQNVILERGIGEYLELGQPLRIQRRDG